MMKREVRDRWVAALRSGEYAQGRYGLCDSQGRYCCLGVLNDVMGNKYISEGGGSRSYLDSNLVAPIYYSGTNVIWLEKQGLGAEDIPVLIKMNDVDGASFSEIADWIEENMEVE